ncbi:hypothetical protein [Sorangium sp. So ce362]|uniref:hypothetical protein n=1 Tax=Sorangium sp. So ce362 TaxID=3133303 RepID=UPI003F5D7C99
MHGRLNSVFIVAFSLFASASSLGCLSTAYDPVGEPPYVAEAELHVTTRDGSLFEGGPMDIRLMENGGPTAQALISARADDGRVWSAVMGLSLDQVFGATVELRHEPLSEGAGTVSFGEAEAPQHVESGTLSFSLESGRTVRGVADISPQDASAEFEGRYNLSCWVRPESLGQPRNGEGVGVEQIQDAEFASPFCSPMAHLR